MCEDYHTRDQRLAIGSSLCSHMSRIISEKDKDT